MANQIIDKALAYVGKNIQKPIIMRYVTVTLQRQYSSVVSVSAPNVDGYTFLIWVNFATSGWIGSVYAANPLGEKNRHLELDIRDIWHKYRECCLLRYVHPKRLSIALPERGCA